MSIILAGVRLPEDMYLEGDTNYQPYIANIDISIGGEEIVFYQRNFEGRKLDLVADPQVWLTQQQVDSLHSLMQKDPFNPLMVLEYHGRVYNVRFRIEDSPVLELEKVVPQMPEPYYYGRIKLKEV